MRARAVAWGAVALTSFCIVVDTVFTALHAPLMSGQTWANHGWPLASLATLGCSVMGALIITKQPRHPIGWLLLVAGLAAVSLASEAYALWALEPGGSGSGYLGHLAGWVSVLCNAPLALCAITIIFLMSPDGRLPSRRWRWVAWTSVAGLASYTGGVLTIPPADFELGPDQQNSLVSATLQAVGILLVAAALVASAASLVVRLRRAHGRARSQLLWIVAAAAALAFGFVFLLALDIVQHEQTLLAATPLFAAFLALPVCVAVAVLRHRLFDIDLIVSRTLMVALATGLVAAGYVAVVVVVGLAVGSGAGGFWPSILATALVAMAFQALRSRVVRIADRVAYGDAAAPYEALGDFIRRLGESPDPAILLPAAAEAAGTAVRARRALVRLEVPGAPDRSASWSTGPSTGPPGQQVQLAVTDRGERLGSVTVELAPGRPARPAEHRLLQDLAHQASIAFRNARLSAELTHQVDELAGRTRQLDESRRRLITAGDAERRRIEASIATRVVPYLRSLPTELDRLAAGGPSAGFDTAGLETLVVAVNSALDELREITRGIFPTQLARSGLAAALAAHVRRTGGGLTVQASAENRRFDTRVENAAFFCVAEATLDDAWPVEVSIGATATELRVVVTGRHIGGLSLIQVRDRVEAAGGTVTRSGSDAATVLDVRLPTGPPDSGDPQGVAAAQASASRSGPKADLGM